MPQSKRIPKPIESFGPEVFQALIEGSKKEIRLPLSWRKACYWRHRANALRAEMRRQNHPQYKVMSGATLRIEIPPGTDIKKSSRNVSCPKSPEAPVFLVISPADAEFGEALRKVGVEIKPLELTKPNTETPSLVAPDPGPESDILSDFLKRGEEEPL